MNLSSVTSDESNLNDSLRRRSHTPPSLYELALSQCQRYATCISDIGDLPYGVVKPWLSKIGREQLVSIEAKSPHIKEQSDELWREFIVRDFKDRKVPSANFRDTYYTYHRDKEAQLGQARERLKLKQQQYHESKLATSVVALSEKELPIKSHGGAAPTFRSPMMRTVAKRTQATSGLFSRRPQYAPQNLVSPSALTKPQIGAQPTSMRLGPVASQADRKVPTPVKAATPERSPSPLNRTLEAPRMLPISHTDPRSRLAKRRRVASVFMPKK